MIEMIVKQIGPLPVTVNKNGDEIRKYKIVLEYKEKDEDTKQIFHKVTIQVVTMDEKWISMLFGDVEAGDTVDVPLGDIEED